MCGRYVSTQSADELGEVFAVDRIEVAEPLPARWNVAPTMEVPVILERAGSQARPQRRLRTLRWGLVPSWSKDLSIGSRMINARVETAAEKPSFRRAFAQRRCLLPADGFYEWYDQAADGRKQPFYLRPREGVLAMAGLYEIWRDRSVPEEDPGAFVWTATILTTSATDEVGHLHERMPLLLPPGAWSGWLDPTTVDTESVRELLTLPPWSALDIYPVATRVNNVRNDGPDLIEPVPLS